MPEPRVGGSAALGCVLFTLFIDLLGVGLIAPILPQLVAQCCGGTPAQAAGPLGWMMALYALMQFAFAPLLGVLSDRFGRRPVLLLSLVGLGVDYLLQAVAPSLGWLFVGRAVAGVMGASVTTASAYIADVSPDARRAHNFGLAGVAFGAAFTLGPALGGVLGSVHVRLPFFVAAALALLNATFGYFVLPESLPAHQRRTLAWRSATPLASLQSLRRSRKLNHLALATVCMHLAQRGLESVWVLYVGKRYGFSTLHSGLTIALVGTVTALVQGTVVRRAVAVLGERRSIAVGTSIAAFCFVGYALATQPWMLFALIMLGGFAGIAGPALQSVFAAAVDPGERGRLQGALTSITSLTAIFAPLSFASGLFAYFTSAAAPFELPGAPFLLGAVLLLAANWNVGRALGSAAHSC